jgi:predicted ArsR family transcriptional regulator
VAFANCPFSDLAAEHPELICGLHRGLVAGFVAEMADTEVREFCSLTSRTPCRVTVSAVTV